MPVSSIGRGRRQHPGPSARCRSKKGESHQGLGRSRGGFGTKIHLGVEGRGKPAAFVLTPGQRREAAVFEELMRQGAVKRRGAGRPRSSPGRVCGDKGYSRGKIRAYLGRRGIRLTIPRGGTKRGAALLTVRYTADATWWSGASTG